MVTVKFVSKCAISSEYNLGSTVSYILNLQVHLVDFHSHLICQFIEQTLSLSNSVSQEEKPFLSQLLLLLFLR